MDEWFSVQCLFGIMNVSHNQIFRDIVKRAGTAWCFSGGCRDDYNGLTSDIFQTILLNVRPLIHYFSNAMYGCAIKLGANVAINGFCPIISENL